MTYKTTQFTPKGDLAQRLWIHCTEEACNGQRYIHVNPQDVVREALYSYDIIPKVQPNCGDRSAWSVGTAVKVSLWEENSAALTKAASDYSKTKQQVITEVLTAYLDQLG